MWWLLACSGANPSGSVPPLVAAAEVGAALDRAVDRIRAHDPQSRSAVYTAYQRFEQTLEPALRSRLPPTEVLGLEYAFAQIADATDDPTRAEAEVASLKSRLEALVPPPTP